MHSYTHNIKTFNSATRHLTGVERLLYRDAIELYYDTEKPLTADFNRLYRLLLAQTEEEKDALKYVLSEFFELTGNVYSHDYCDEQIDKYHKMSTDKAKAGMASARARKEKAEQRKAQRLTGVEQVLNRDPSCDANHKPVTSNHKPVKNKETVKKAVIDFNNFWIDWPKKVDKKDCLQEWKKMSDEKRQLAIDGTTRFITGKEIRYIKSPIRYLKKELWNDEVISYEENKQYNQSAKNKELEESNRNLFAKAEVLNRAANSNARGSGLLEIMGDTSNPLPATKF